MFHYQYVLPLLVLLFFRSMVDDPSFFFFLVRNALKEKLKKGSIWRERAVNFQKALMVVQTSNQERSRLLFTCCLPKYAINESLVPSLVFFSRTVVRKVC